jgi:hypothetical protein
VYKPWGTGEGKKGDWVLVGPNDDVYTCDAAIFLKTYVRVDPTRPHLFRKTGKLALMHSFICHCHPHMLCTEWLNKNR